VGLLVAAVCAAVSLAASGCGGSSDSVSTTLERQPPGTHYPPVERTQFVASCEAEANSFSTAAPATVASYCRCALTFLEVHLSYNEMVKASKAVLEAKAASPYAQTALKTARDSCSKRVLGKVDKTFG
jgi:hypothetical protein